MDLFNAPIATREVRVEYTKIVSDNIANVYEIEFDVDEIAPRDWAQPAGVPEGTPNWGDTIELIYDNDESTACEMDEVQNHPEFPYAYFGITFEDTQVIDALQWKNNDRTYNHIQAYKVMVLISGGDPNEPSDWMEVAAEKDAVFGWNTDLFDEPVSTDAIRIHYTRIIGDYAAPVYEVQFDVGVIPDNDGDGIPDEIDPDDDNDGIADWADPDPLDSGVVLAPAWPADSAAQANHSWTFVAAASGFLDAVVIAGPPTYHGPDPGTVRLRNVTDLGFDLRFQEWDYRERDLGDTYHAREDIPYLVLQPGIHTMSDGSVWEVGSFPLGGTGGWTNLPFTQPFSKTPHLFLTVQTYNGNQAVSLRARNVTDLGFEAALLEEEWLMDGHATETIGYLAIDSPSGGHELIDLDGDQVPYLLQSLKADERWSPALSQRLKVEEEKSKDSEVDHTDETLHVLAIGNQILAQQVSHNGGDTTALRRLEPTKDAPMEWGLIRGIDHGWQTLPFAKTYIDPILVAKPASNNGSDPGVIRLINVSSGTYAYLRYQEWNYLDGIHSALEDVFYMVSEAGQHSLGGLTLEADHITTHKLGRTGQWEHVPFNALFTPPAEGLPAPVVFTSVMTSNEDDAVTTRIKNLDLTGLDLAMDEQESKSDGHLPEVLGWIAIQTGTGTTADGRALEVFFDQLDHALTPVVYSGTTSHRHPTILGDIDSTYGGNPVFLRYANPTNAQIELKLAEEQSADTETSHVLEDVGAFVGE